MPRVARNKSPTPTVALAIEPREEALAWLRPIRAAMKTVHVPVRVELMEDLTLEDLTYAVAWGTVAGLADCPNLKAIVSLGAGVDHILADDELAHLPVIRMIDPGLTQGMREFALMATLWHHRRMPEFVADQRHRDWKPRYVPLAQNRRVGIMGLGVLGDDAAKHLATIGFDVAGWSRRAHRVEGVKVFAGTVGLKRFLARSDILICLLPLTPETRGILNARLFKQLPKGAAVINLARGGHMIESDLVAALDSGHLSGATLDVFDREPLPRASRLWGHPKVTITPHVASLTQRDTGSQFVAEAIKSLLAGKRPKGLVDRRRGY